MKALLVLTVLATAGAVVPLSLPGARGGAGFDDLRFSSDLRKLLVPGGRSGRLYLVDAKTRAVEAIAGFSAAAEGGRGHSEGTTSADSGEGLIFASDRNDRTLVVVDPATRRILAREKLGSTPDYVRWVAPLGEVWVTEPGAKAIETWRLSEKSPPKLTPGGKIEVADGPESLEIDPQRRRAYANTWHDVTVSIDLGSRAIASRWRNGCEGARGLAVDAERGLAFVGCKEGKAVVLDVEHDGKVLASAPAGNGVDVIAFSGKLSHLYVPGADAANLTVLGVSARGELQVLGAVATAPDGHCVAADDQGNAYVCDPGKGQLLVFRDPYPASR
jgi:DNA-binding beta-propeller fold protein YncE